MSIAIITGSGGLIGAESAKFFSKKFDRIIGIDNDSRQYFFGKSASVRININFLKITQEMQHLLVEQQSPKQ